MFSFNREKAAASAGSAILWAWVVFTSLFTLYSLFFGVLQSSKIQAAQQSGYAQGANAVSQQAMQSFSGNVFQNGYSSAVSQLVGELAKQYEGGCTQAVPVSVGTGSIGLLSADCLQKITASGATAPEAAPVKK
jgi:hypothetical protein